MEIPLVTSDTSIKIELHTMNVDNHCQLFVWVLEDYGSGKWTLKHTANVLGLFGRYSRKDDESYKMLAIHPDCNSFFLTDGKMTVLYNMDIDLIFLLWHYV